MWLLQKTSASCSIRWGLLTVLISMLHASAEEVYTPPVGSAERLAVIRFLRADFYLDKQVAEKNPRGITFVLMHLKVKDGWACVKAQPTHDRKGEGEPRWKLIRKVGGRWEDMDYFSKLFPFASEEETLDALEMKKATVEKLILKLPGCPREIFP